MQSNRCRYHNGLEKMVAANQTGVVSVAVVFLYAAILITTNLQYASDAKPKKQPPPSPDALMMSIAATPLSIYLKIRNIYLRKTPQPTSNP